MSVWDDLVGQHRVIEALQAAADGHGMSHAFLFTGPPGSGRSNAALAFAAALQCEEQPRGCGTCKACHTVLARSHADLTVVSQHGWTVHRRECELRHPHLVIQGTAFESAECQRDQDAQSAEPMAGFQNPDVKQPVVHPGPPRRREPRR